MTILGDNFNSPICPIVVTLSVGSTLGCMKRESNLDIKLSPFRCNAVMPCRPKFPRFSTAAKARIQTRTLERRDRNRHSAQKTKTHSPQKNETSSSLGWTLAEKRQMMKYGYETFRL